METTTVSLIIGSLCAGLVWWSVQGFVRRCSGKAQPKNNDAQRQCDDAPWERTGEVYRKLLYLRLASFALCILAAAALYFHLGTALAVGYRLRAAVLRFPHPHPACSGRPQGDG